jgi:two-component system, NarL family, nitrate/nitrite response regulator NarL
VRASEDVPHVALLDVPDDVGLSLIVQLRKVAPELKSVVIGVTENEADVVAWAEAGVAGYVTIDDSVDDLIATVAAVIRGETRCTPRMTAALLRRVETLASASAFSVLFGSLTEREMQVANLLADGLSDKEIALSLSIALPTVKSHVHRILGKLNSKRRGEAAARLRARRLPDRDHSL